MFLEQDQTFPFQTSMIHLYNTSRFVTMQESAVRYQRSVNSKYTRAVVS